MNIHTKINFMKCFFKIEEDWGTKEFE